jgi:hypothetical protein
LHLAIDELPWWKMILGHACHRWMSDALSFSKLLSQLGYINVRQRAYGEGKVPAVTQLDFRSAGARASTSRPSRSAGHPRAVCENLWV